VEIGRYHRQELLPQIGKQGQEKLRTAKVLVVGCGALGSHLAEQLVRSGVGTVRIADRDIVETTNLQRQVLFTEDDVKRGMPKALAAAERLVAINSEVTIDPRVVDVDANNIEELATMAGDRVDLILDGTDNVETRYLINDVTTKLGIPWIYGGCVGIEGRVMAIVPGETPCLRCLFPDVPKGSELPTCDTAGVLGPAVAVVAALQAITAIKLLTGNRPSVKAELLTMDLWSNRFHAMDVSDGRRPECVCCGQKQFVFLESRSAKAPTRLCGRDAVQVSATQSQTIDLEILRRRLATGASVEGSKYFMRAVLKEPAGIVITVFSDGRAIITGTRDEARARSIYARFVGS
jgi:molybdopterin-synthase adenylyltransferase